MDPIAIFITGMLLIAVLFGPKYGAESRPGFKDPDIKPRPNSVPSDWRSPF
jgi:hypothetical protein